MTFWRTICYCHSRFADRELLFINLDETSVGHTMTPPIGCVAKPRTAGGKQPHAQVLKQHVRGAWTYVSVICNCKHIQGKFPHFLIGTQVKLTKKLLRAQRALPQTRLRVLRQKSAWTSAANSAQILKEIAEVLKSFPSKQGVVYSLIVRRHTCHGRSWQWHASASCSLYISQRRQRITYSRLICKASPLLNNI